MAFLVMPRFQYEIQQGGKRLLSIVAETALFHYTRLCWPEKICSGTALGLLKNFFRQVQLFGFAIPRGEQTCLP